MAVAAMAPWAAATISWSSARDVTCGVQAGYTGGAVAVDDQAALCAATSAPNVRPSWARECTTTAP